MNAKIATVRIAPLPRAVTAAGRSVPKAILIDVQRATSSLVTAFAHGLREVRIVPEVEAARQVAQEIEARTGHRPLLGGERNFVSIDGFNLSNSPHDYEKSIVYGNSLVFTSTNGARAVRALSDAQTVALGAFLNLKALLHFCDTDVLLLCSGTHGQPSDEDELLAGTIATVLHDEGHAFADQITADIAHTARLALAHGDLWWRIMNESKNALGLKRAGLEADLAFVSRIDAFPDILPVRDDPASSRFVQLRTAPT